MCLLSDLRTFLPPSGSLLASLHLCCCVLLSEAVPGEMCLLFFPFQESSPAPPYSMGEEASRVAFPAPAGASLRALHLHSPKQVRSVGVQQEMRASEMEVHECVPQKQQPVSNTLKEELDER